MAPSTLDFNLTVTELFELQVKKNPQLIALKDLYNEFSYLALNEKANQFAHTLKSHSVKSGDFVAILLEPNVDVFISILAIIKLGAVYVPLDTHAPKARLYEILQDANPKIIITSDEYYSTFKDERFNVLLFSQLNLASKNFSKKNPIHSAINTSPLYMIYTSGSTGKPKGVVIPHRAVINLAVTDNITSIKEGEKAGQFCNIAFDGSVFESWNALLNGATLFVIPGNARKNHNQLKKILKEFKIRYLVIPTGYFHQLIKSFPETLDALHTISFGGEQINVHLLKDFIVYRKKIDLPTTLINVYGPTEATVFSCCNIIKSDLKYSDEQLASIGHKTANTSTYILDEHRKATDEGELWVSGVHLALYYHNSPEQTEDKFVNNPFSTDELFSKIYRTGDRVRRLPTGELLYLGRYDDQVKIGGFRIHLSEIEQCLMSHEAISLASVTVEIGGSSHQFLKAYIVFANDCIQSAEQIRSFLVQKLPSYMLPAKYVMVEKLPLTPIGKVDKTKLNKISNTDLSPHIEVSSNSSIEETIKTIWKDLLNLSFIESNKNLFDLGANSLLLTEACSRINKDLHCDLEMIDLLTHSTIEKLSCFLEGTFDRKTKRKTKRIESHDIAIIGMSCRFPKAQTIEEYWHVLCEGTDCLTRFDELDLPSSLINSESFVPVKGILENVDKFDAHFFNFSPIAAKITDPQHRIFLECVWEALENAAIAPTKIPSKVISVFSGMADSTYLKENIEKNHWSRNEMDTFQQRIATSMGMLSTQVSYRLNFKGRSVNINTACSTGLVTIDHACQDLILGQSDIALAGASSIFVPEIQGYFYQNGGIVSKDGHCRPFSSESNGTVFSNGVGVVVLKRLEDAIKDKNTIYAVIKGRGVNNDGADKLGFTAPSLNGQISCIQDALSQARINPEEISYLEAHGTATTLGDAIEVKALNMVYREYTDKIQFCALGSAKANIGHTDVTAGIAGLIKTALCLYHKKIPPLVHFKTPNPDLSLLNSPFYVNTKLKDWSTSSKRYAAVSSFGVGGTNAHIILCEYEREEISPPSTPAKEELILLSAKSENALNDSANNMKHYLMKSDDANLGNIAFTLQNGREDFQWRQFSVGKKSLEICDDLERKKPLFVDERTRPNLVFMFSGQGSQYAKMAMGLLEEVPQFAHYFHLGAKLARPFLKCDLLSLIRDKDSTKLYETEYAQPTLFIVEYALSKVLMECGVVPEVLIGHSIGEYVAACLSEVFSFEEGIELVCKRGLLMAQASRGSMLAIETTKELLEQYLKIADVDVALHNTNHHFVLSGSLEEISKLEEYLTGRALPFHRLKVSHPFHSRHMTSIEHSFKELFANIKLSAPKIPIIANATGDWLSVSEATSPNYWYRHLREAVQFSKCIHRILQDRTPLFVEIGPGQSLCGFIKEINNKADTFYTIPGRHQPTSDLFQLLSSLGELWTKGINITLENLVDTQNPKHIPLPTYPFQRQRYWIEPDISPISKNVESFYKPVWSYIEIAETPSTYLKNYEFVIFKDSMGIGDKIIHALICQGIQPFVVQEGEAFKQINGTLFAINLHEKSDYLKLILCLKEKLINPVIFHCLTCNRSTEGYLDTEQVEDNLNHSFYSLLFLTQALIDELGSAKPIHLAIITTATQRIVGTEDVCPINATLVGASRVIPQEHPNISCELIDINLDEDITYLLTDAINSSIQTQKEKPSQFTAYRNGYRWELSYLNYSSKKTSPCLADNKIYLITGGLGGIGLSLCLLIARICVSPTFILCSRTTEIQESAWAGIAADHEHPLHHKILQLQRLKELGANIVWQQADIGNYEETLNLIAFCKANLGGIDGLIHAAGVAGGGLLQLKTKEAAHKVVVSKVHGTYHLARALTEFRLDFVVLMSSIASITGEPGQFDYCAANSCLDAFANSRLFNAKSLLSINWNTWRDVGMSIENKRPKDINLFNRGNTIAPSQGQELFLQALESGCSNLIVSNMSVEEYSKQSLYAHTIAEDEHKDSRETFNLTHDFTAPVGGIEQCLAKLWESNLHIADIGRDDDFFDLGGHSLKALNLIQHINYALKSRLSIQHLYQAPTIHELAKMIENNNEKTQVEIIIPLKTTNSNHYPFFFCHPISGMVYCFKDFTAHWDFPIPLYAIQDPSIATGRMQFDSILSMAKTYLQAIKKIQPHGPYFLLGYSLGGTVMYEVAHLLQSQNKSIGLLAMIESWCEFSPQQKCRSYIEDSDLLKEFREDQVLMDLSWERMQLLLNHKPTKTKQDIVLFKATELSKDYQELNEPLNGWEKYSSGKIICHAIKANHDTIIREGCKFIAQQLIKHRDFTWELEPSL